MRGIHRSPVNCPHKGQWHGALMFFFYLSPNKRLSKHWWGWWFETPTRHYDVILMFIEHIRICFRTSPEWPCVGNLIKVCGFSIILKPAALGKHIKTTFHLLTRLATFVILENKVMLWFKGWNFFLYGCHYMSISTAMRVYIISVCNIRPQKLTIKWTTLIELI